MQCGYKIPLYSGSPDSKHSPLHRVPCKILGFALQKKSLNTTISTKGEVIFSTQTGPCHLRKLMLEICMKGWYQIGRE